MTERRNLLGMPWPALTDFLCELGQPEYRARQIMEWIYGRGVDSFSEMSNLSKDLRARLEEVAQIGSGEVVERQTAADGTMKLAIRFPDQSIVETVVLRYHHGVSLCLSTQVGCKMGCGFCASGLGGYANNLTSAQIIEQIWLANRELAPINLRISHLVYMGMGEPLDNYENVIASIRLANNPLGFNIGMRNITLSTSGLVPRIYDLAEEKIPITLSISLHAPVDYIRDQIMPINQRYKLTELMQAAKYYAASTKRRITFEYILLKGLNDQAVHADQLAQLLQDMLCNVNLIPYNPVPELPWQAPTERQVKLFHQRLAAAGVNATIRRELGPEIEAACGQLRRRLQGEEKG